jgi:hypothetical protein
MNAIYNPRHRPERDLPVIMGFANGSFKTYYIIGVLIAEDGTCLGSDVSSNESYLMEELGIKKGSRPDRHEGFRKRYPGGYRMEYVDSNDPRLIRALARRQQPEDNDATWG